MTTAELLRKAADALDNGQVPLENPFLADNEVTLDQCMALAGQLAIGARLVARAIDNPRTPLGLMYLREIAGP